MRAKRLSSRGVGSGVVAASAPLFAAVAAVAFLAATVFGASSPSSSAAPPAGARCYRFLFRADFPNCKLLAPGFALHWAVRGDNVTLGLDADTGGFPDSWMAVALSAAGGMRGADMIIIAGHKEDDAGAAAPPPATTSGGWRVIDAHSVDFVEPVPDESQDVALMGTPLSGDGHTVGVVTRRLRTCDPWDWPIMAGTPQTVSWAYGRVWPSKHLARGNSAVSFVPEADAEDGGRATANTTAAANATSTTAAIAAADEDQDAVPARLLSDKEVPIMGSKGIGGNGSKAEAQPVPRVGKLSGGNDDPWVGDGNDDDGDGDVDGDSDAELASEPGVMELDVRMLNITVPDNATTNYLCTRVTLPHDRKYHLIGSRPIVKSDLIHHMILFACTKPPPPSTPAVVQCAESGGGEGCFTFYIGWAPGITGSSLPPSVGLPIGESDSTYFSLQVHYNNPDRVSGVVDDSGFTLLYTPKLRTYDAAILTVGQQAISIPPGVPDFKLQPNVCPSSCTSRLRSPLRLLYSGLHMHTLGRSIVTQHIRNGTELPPVGSKRFYDFDYQSQDPVPLDSSLLLPGDVLVTTCSYDSTSRTNTTTFGESTTDEMCFNFILYYPRDPGFGFCMSMDAAGDPRVAVCANSTEAAQVGAAVAQLVSANATTLMSGGGGSAIASSNLSAVPSLAPLFKMRALVRVPASDLQYKPYNTSCPDMWYMEFS